MWGVGATVGPYIMGYALSGGLGWQSGYRVIGLIQIGLTAVLIFSLPLWKKMGRSISLSRQMAVDSLPLSPRQVLRLPGAREAFGCFFAYCALEQTAGLWGSSYLVLHGNMSADRAAGFAALFYLGITVGRALNGFLAIRYEDDTLIRMGEGILAVGGPASFDPRRDVASGSRSDPGGTWMRADLSVHCPFHAAPFRPGKIPGCDRRPDGLRVHRKSFDAAAFRPSGQSYRRISISVLSFSAACFYGDAP